MRKWLAMTISLSLMALTQSTVVGAADFPNKDIIIIVAGSLRDALPK